MELWKHIANAIRETRGFGTALIARSDLQEWQTAAERLEDDKRAAWRSFYVACGVVGLLIATCIWLRLAARPTCDRPFASDQHAEVMQLEPTEIRASGSEVYEL